MTSTSVLGNTHDHAAVRPRPQHRRRRAATCRPPSTPPAASCPRTCRARRRIRKVNPADSPILILSVQSDALPLTDGRRLRRQHPRAADLADRRASRRSPSAAQQKPAVRVQVDPAKLAALGLQLEDVRDRHQRRDGQRAQGRDRRRRRTASPSTPTTSCSRPRPGTTSSSPTRTARRCACATSARRSTAPRTRQLVCRRWQQRHSDGVLLLDLQAAGRQRHRDRRRDQGGAAARCRRTIPPSIQVEHDRRPHHDHPRLGARRGVHAAAHHRAGGDGDLPVPAQRLGDHHPERHRAAGAARHLRR